MSEGAWEMVLYQLVQTGRAQRAEAQLLSLASRRRTFASPRFVRFLQGRRRFSVSTMTLLRRRDVENGSYLEFSDFLSIRGSPSHKDDFLCEPRRRIVFNILVSNRDDHLFNHGSILETGRWRLASAYDVNPNNYRIHHQLAIDPGDPAPDVELALAIAGFHCLSDA